MIRCKHTTYFYTTFLSNCDYKKKNVINVFVGKILSCNKHQLFGFEIIDVQVKM